MSRFSADKQIKSNKYRQWHLNTGFIDVDCRVALATRGRNTRPYADFKIVWKLNVILVLTWNRDAYNVLPEGNDCRGNPP